MATSTKTKEKCLFEASSFVFYKLETSHPLYVTVNFIRSLHKVIYSYYKPAAGNFRTHVYRAYVTSKTFKPCPPHLIVAKIMDLNDFINKPRTKAGQYSNFTKDIKSYSRMSPDAKHTLFVLFCGCYVHHQLSIIHPFTGGNGRLARLLLSMELASHGLWKATFPPLLNSAILLHRGKYLDVLSEADKGNMIPFVMFVGDMLSYSIKKEKYLEKIIDKKLGKK